MLNSRRGWFASALAVAFAAGGVAIAIDASAQQRRPAAKAVKKAPAKKAPARKTPAKKATPRVVPATPVVPIGPPPVTIAPGANTLGAHAAIYLNFVADTRAVSVAQATSGLAITQMTERVARHGNSERLAIGIVAYGAAHAATVDEFVADARRVAAELGRDAFIQKLRTEYAFARTLRGADAAQAKALRAVLADAGSVAAKAETFKMAAYDLQSRPWAVARVSDAAARNLALTNLAPPVPVPANAVTFSSLPETMLSPETTAARASRLDSTPGVSTMAERDAVTLPATIPAWSPADRMLATAALAAIGAPADRQADTEFVMRDPRLVSCINVARLNLRMCNAATRQPYERIFCLAEHPIGESGRCLNRAAR